MGPPIPPLTLVPIAFALAWGAPAATSNTLGCASSGGECSRSDENDSSSTLMQMARSVQGLNVALNRIRSMKQTTSVQKLVSLMDTLMLSRAVIDETVLKELNTSILENTMDPLLALAQEAQTSLDNRAFVYYNLTFNHSHTTEVTKALLEGVQVIENCIEKRKGDEATKKEKCTALAEFDRNFGSLCLEQYLKELETFKDKNALTPALEACGKNALTLAIAFEPLREACENATAKAESTSNFCKQLYDAFSLDYCQHRNVVTDNCLDFRKKSLDAENLFNELYDQEMKNNKQRQEEYEALNRVLCIVDLMSSKNSMTDVAASVSTCTSKPFTKDWVKHEPLQKNGGCSTSEFGKVEGKYSLLDIQSAGKCEWTKDATASFNVAGEETVVAGEETVVAGEDPAGEEPEFGS